MLDIIELSSSPEPTQPAAFTDTAKKSKRAGKAKAITGPIFDLTNSDDDDVFVLPLPPEQEARDVAGPSRSRHEVIFDAPSPSVNIPGQSTKANGATVKAPLFLPGDDEENHPPQEAPSLDLEMIHPSQPPTVVVDTPENETQNLLLAEFFEPDPESATVARVLEMIPDVETDHLLALVRKHAQEHPANTLVEHIVHRLFEGSPYPRVDRKGKGKRKQSDEADVGRDGVADADDNATPSKRIRIDYATISRPFTGGVHYANLALDQLQEDFPNIPKSHLRTTLANNKSFYAPTHLSLKQIIQDHEKNGTSLPYNPKGRPYRPNSKGKKRELHDPEFDAELAWIVSQNLNPDDDNENGIECGCCFTTYPFAKMVQCPETHLFCIECMTTYASTLLGSHDPNIVCMDQSGCKAAIPASELHRFLPQKLMDLWERVKQRKEVELAGLEGLEECPFCDWSCVIENPDEKLFRCENVEICGEVSCRSCKKADHLPKSCKEAEDDKHLDGRHTVEEAMTRALMRNCPNCKKAFVKESGCNRMTCPFCGTTSCYVCRRAAPGYDHFDQGTGKPGCPLHDSVEQRHADEVKRAADAALAQYKHDHPDIDEKEIKVDLPVAAPPTQGSNYYYPVVNHAHVQAQAALNQAAYNVLRLEADEGVQEDRMLGHERELQLKQNRGLTIQEIATLDDNIARARDEWYRARQRTEHARQAERQARVNLAGIRHQGNNMNAILPLF